jgi:hypothetical protein
MKSPGLTRRALAIYAAPVLLGGTAKAQPAPAPPGRSQFPSAAQQLSAVKLARNIEPATRFEA